MRKKMLIIVIFLVATLPLTGCSLFGGNDHQCHYSSEWKTDAQHHWHVCVECNKAGEKSDHRWDSGVVTTPATENALGVMTYTCLDCGYKKEADIPKIEHITHNYDQKVVNDLYLKSGATCDSGAVYYYSCVCGEKGSNTFVFGDGTGHTFSKEWSYDETTHWHASTCGHESEISGKEEHSWNNGVVTKNPSESESGIKKYECQVCGAIKEEEIAPLPHTHTYLKGWTSDETYHWHASACGHESEISGKAEHSWDDGVVTKNATETETGIKTYTCEVCKKTKAEIIPTIPHVHTFSSEWSYDDDTHWHSATCEHVTIKNEEETHQWVDTGRVVTEATDFVEGEEEQKCSICNKTRVIKTGYAGHVHTYETEAWTSDSKYHWHASTCGHFVVSDKSIHTWDAGTIKKQATVYDEGVMIYKCTVCGLEKEESISELESFTVVFLDKDNRTLSERNYALKTSNKDVKLPITIQLDGYYFNGWFEISTTVNVSAFDFSTATNNQIYYFKAKYEKQYTVLFEDYLGNQLASIVVIESKNSIAEEDCPKIPSREGFASYWDMQKLRDISSNMIVLPVYEEITFEVVFKDKDGNVLSYTDVNGDVIKKQIVPYGSFAIEPEYEQYYLDKSEMKFYEFKEWSADFSTVKSNLEIVAIYDILYDKPVIAAKMNGTTLSMSILLPNNETKLYCLSFSFGWSVDKGTCSISNAILRSESPLDEMNEQGHICTVGQKEDWLKYNNKTHTFDFVWNCGEGHAPNNTHRIDNIIVLTFNVDDGAKFDDSIFTMADNSVIIYGDINDEITNLKTIKPIVWFYE